MDDLTPSAPRGYALVAAIGRGASSVVWEAQRLATGGPVALKILDADVSDPDALRRFERERAAMTALARHPHILTILDAGTQDGRPWLAMELCRRGSLAAYVAAGGPLDLPTTLRVLDRLAGALAVAHDAGVVHCDIKPANVMLTDAGEPALGDFGIARVSVGRATTTTVGGFSLDHVAPELLGDGRRSPRSDVYSLGTTAWELLAGHPPFRQSQDVSVGAVLTRVLTQPLPDSPRIHPELLGLLRHLAAKAPEQRPASMREVGGAIRTVAGRLGIPLDAPALPAATAVEVEIAHLPLAVVDAGLGGAATHRRLRAVAPPAPAPAGLRVGGLRVPIAAAALVLVALIGAGTFGAYRYVGGWTAAPVAVTSAVAAPAPAAQPAPLVAAAPVVAAPVAPPPVPVAAAPGAPAPPVRPVARPVPPTPTPPPPVTPTPPPPVPPSPDVTGDGRVTCDDLYVVREQRGAAASDVDHNGVVDRADAAVVIARLPGGSDNSCYPPPVGDLDRNGHVGCNDMAILRAQWGRSGSADLNRNGVVDLPDLSMLLSHWNEGRRRDGGVGTGACATTAPSPAPTTAPAN